VKTEFNDRFLMEVFAPSPRKAILPAIPKKYSFFDRGDEILQVIR
jgi:hypothetical protein